MKKLKRFGQHFLNVPAIAQKIADSILINEKTPTILVEVGPGDGVLTQYLVQKTEFDLYLVELDKRLPALLRQKFPTLSEKIIEQDILRVNFKDFFQQSFVMIGNFPYNISSQIIFKVIDYKEQIPQMVGMFQKELAERVAAKPGSKIYGVISVLTQVYYNVNYLFTVDAQCFSPPPKVQSAVIRLTRTRRYEALITNHKHFKQVVKMGFAQRRKKLKNNYKGIQLSNKALESELLQLRAEQLSIEDFIFIANEVC